MSIRSLLFAGIAAFGISALALAPAANASHAGYTAAASLLHQGTSGGNPGDITGG